MYLSGGEIISAFIALALASAGTLIAWGSRATKIIHLEEAIKEFKKECATLRIECQDNTCGKLEVLTNLVIEHRNIVSLGLKENGEKFERIAGFMGEVRTYIRLKNGGTISGKID